MEKLGLVSIGGELTIIPIRNRLEGFIASKMYRSRYLNGCRVRPEELVADVALLPFTSITLSLSS